MTSASALLVFLIATDLVNGVSKLTVADELVVSGPVTAKPQASPQKDEAPYRVFQVQGKDSVLFIRLNMPHGASQRWESALAKSSRASVRIIPNKPEAAGALPNDPRLASDVICVVDSGEQTAQFSMFALSCLSTQSRPDGPMLREIGIAVAAQRGSESEAFLIASGRQPIFAKLEI
jgi:hypothetical protein